MTGTSGTYRLTAWCMLGTDGFESANAFEYEPVMVTLVNPAPPPEPVPPVKGTPAYTG